MNKEVWKPVVGYEGLYEVSNFGRVKSLEKEWCTGIGMRYHKDSIMRQHRNRNYWRIALSNGDKKQKKYFVHRLEWEAFYGPIPEGYEINHLDENGLNNRLDNLSLVTHTENNNWGTRNARVASARTNHPNLSKPVLQFTKDGKFIGKYLSVIDAKRQTGIDNSGISCCCKYKKHYNSAGGFKWFYADSTIGQMMHRISELQTILPNGFRPRNRHSLPVDNPS